MRFLRSYVIVSLFGVSVLAGPDDLLRRTASWHQPTMEDCRSTTESWILERDDSAEAKGKFTALWASVEEQGFDGILPTVAKTIGMVHADANEIVKFCSSPKAKLPLPTFAILQQEELSPFARNNLRLYYAKWLGEHQLYDEVDEQLEGIKPSDVVDPASLLFFQAIAKHRLLKKDECLPILERLLEQPDSIPRRYATLAKLMQADIAPLKTDSLDEVSRMMDNIKVTLGHGRAGARVRKTEDDVIAKLDKMIEKLEEQAQQQQQQQQQSQNQSQNSKQASNPMQDSMPGGISGPGNVDAKKLEENAEWGDLPPKERERALQELGKDLPSHFRDVIEDYFQKLARENR